VVAFQVGVGAALVTGQVDIEIAVLTECGAVGAIAADRLSGHLTWREAPGYGDCCAPEHPLENAAPINANREVFDEPIKTTAIHPSASLRCARDRRTEPPPHGRQAYDNRVAPFDRNVQVYLAHCTYTYTVNMQDSALSVTSQSVTVASQAIAEARVHQGMVPTPTSLSTCNFDLVAGWFGLNDGAGLDDRRALLAHHDRRRLRVAADQLRHDRRIDDAQSLETVHAELRIDDRHLVVAHLAGADWVVVGF